MTRGNRQERIFVDDDDRRFFLKALSEVCGMTGWRVHAWVLMTNHYHLMIETPEPNLVTGMQWLQNAYTRRFNTRHREWGRLFGDRYKAIVVQGDEGSYYCSLMDYIHLNPVRARIIRPAKGQSVVDYPWSSVAAGYMLPPKKRAPWLAVEDGLRALQLKDTADGRRKFVEHLDRRCREEAARECGVPELPEDARLSNLRRGWYWGTQAFAEKLRELLVRKSAVRTGRPRRGIARVVTRTHDESEAERLVRQGLSEYELAEEDLPKLRGSDPRKVGIAQVVRAQTGVSQSWIAERLHMRSAGNVSQQLRRAAGTM